MLDLRLARSFLFVPGDRPDRFAKATASGADQVVLDLEDAVQPDRKDAARRSVAGWLAAGGTGLVRINGAGTEWHAEDVAMAAEHGCPVMLPKADADSATKVTRALRPDADMIALAETAAGVLGAAATCSAPGVVRVAFGSVDLGTEIGLDASDYDVLAMARSALVLASAASGLPAPIDGVTVGLRDADAVRTDAVAAAHLGFGAKLCVHPNQVVTVNEVFTPSDAECRQAAAVVQAAGAGGAGVLDGKMIDRPVLDRARRLLARAARLDGERAAATTWRATD